MGRSNDEAAAPRGDDPLDHPSVAAPGGSKAEDQSHLQVADPPADDLSLADDLSPADDLSHGPPHHQSTEGDGWEYEDPPPVQTGDETPPTA